MRIIPVPANATLNYSNITFMNVYGSGEIFSWEYDTDENRRHNGVVTITPKRAGEFKVYARLDTHAFEACGKIKVLPVPATDISFGFSDSEVILGLRESYQLKPNIFPSNSTTTINDFELTSSNNDILTIGESGLITACDIGSAKLTIKSNDLDFIAEKDFIVLSALVFKKEYSFGIISQNGNGIKTWDGKLEYYNPSLGWTEWNGERIDSFLNVNNQHCLCIRGQNNTKLTRTYYDYESGKYKYTEDNWYISSRVSVFGDIRYLLDYQDPENSTMAPYCFSHLFYTCNQDYYTIYIISYLEFPSTILTEGCYSYLFHNARFDQCIELPAINLETRCYENMFGYCSIYNGILLPATTLAPYCYSGMFHDSNLASSPALPVTTLADHCYNSMFDGCTSLTSAPELPATTLAPYCYSRMFADCMYLTTPPELPATVLAEGCYSGLFLSCDYLSFAPELPATILADYCYNSMFEGCRFITSAPELPATTLAPYCYSRMFADCMYLTTPPELPATVLAEGCYDSMFFHSSLASSPALPATTLAPYCYKSMFSNSALASSPALPATTLAPYCYFRMFYHCLSLTSAPALPATTLADYCYSYMFYECSSLKFSGIKTGKYQNEFKLGSGNAENPLSDMFDYHIGGAYEGTPRPGQTLYTSNEVIY